MRPDRITLAASRAFDDPAAPAWAKAPNYETELRRVEAWIKRHPRPVTAESQLAALRAADPSWCEAVLGKAVRP